MVGVLPPPSQRLPRPRKGEGARPNSYNHHLVQETKSSRELLRDPEMWQ